MKEAYKIDKEGNLYWVIDKATSSGYMFKGHLNREKDLLKWDGVEYRLQINQGDAGSGEEAHHLKYEGPGG